MDRWEYIVIKNKGILHPLTYVGEYQGIVHEGELDQLLNELGREGWELVNVFLNGSFLNGVLKRKIKAGF